MLDLIVTCIIILHYSFISKRFSIHYSKTLFLLLLFATCLILQELQINHYLQSKIILANLSRATCHLVVYVLINSWANLIGIFSILLSTIEKKFFTKHWTKLGTIFRCLYWERETNMSNEVQILTFNFKNGDHKLRLTRVF